MADLGFSEASQSVIVTDENNQIEIRSFVDTLSDTNFGLIVRSLLLGRDSGGTYRNLLMDSSGNAGIFATSLPLPTGAATETTLSAINTKITQNYGVATEAIRVAALLGNASGVAAFNAGITDAQTLRVVLPTDQSSIPVTQSGTWNIGTITNAVTVNQGTSPWVVSGTVTANAGTGTFAISAVSLPLPTGAATETTLAAINTKINLDFGVSTGAIRTAAQIGNATGAAAFNAGTTTAQTLRVVLPTDQTAIPVSQSGSWTTGRTWTLASGTDSVSAVQSGTWNIGTLTSITNPVTVNQGTSPWVISGTVTASEDKNYGVVGATTLRVASQIGNDTGAAAFGSGTTNAQTLRVVLPTDQSITVSNLLNSNGVNGGITVTTTAIEAKVGISRLSDRESLTVYNDGPQNIFWGYSNAVTATNGTPIFKGQFGDWDIGDGLGVWLITSSGSSNCRITEAF